MHRIIENRRRSTHTAWLLVLPLSICSGCDTSNHAVVAGTDANGTATERLISDQTHYHGSRGFRFLPPMVPPTGAYGDFVPGLPVSVRVDELSTAGAVSRSLATFTPTGGPRGERLRTHLQGAADEFDDHDGDNDPSGYYYARWHTDDEHLSPAARYRVRVLVPAKGGQSHELGFADVDVVRTAREFKRVDAQEYTPLINGITLRIKFRVGLQAVDDDGDGVYDWLDNCPRLANPDQVDSLANGIGDACRCQRSVCPRRDACHVFGRCEPTTGQCQDTPVPDGQPCPMLHADAICLEGVCQLQTCHSLRADCNGDPSDGCETTITSKENCGGCGQSCNDSPAGSVTCRSAQCVLRCQKGMKDCDGDLTTGCETNTGNDPNNCGACGRTCLNQEACVRGGCTARTCQEGWANCDRFGSNGCETNVGSDVKHCGSCGHECEPLPNAVSMCEAGECRIGFCNEGFADCNGLLDDGCEASLLEETTNCGECGSSCAPANARGECIWGVCNVASCLSGFTDCDGNSNNGCEVALGSDVGNCGSCGTVCSVINGSSRCLDGRCQIASCDGGMADCDGNVANGCESHLTTDVSNCGDCGIQCPEVSNGQSTCVAGKCGQSCNPGFADCDRVSGNGCETWVGDNCGSCGNVCSLPNAVGECIGGGCEFLACDLGHADCDGLRSNGCEVELSSDVGNCGACDLSCARPNQTSTCVNGECMIGACKAPYGDCDGIPANGCEANLDLDPKNCQSCGSACPSTFSCLPRVGCACPLCFPTSLGVCPDYRTDPQNCGGCGWQCKGGEYCVNGSCTCGPERVACGSRDYGNYSCCPILNSDCGTGTCLYFDISSDPKNCGGRGIACVSGYCVSGQCLNFQSDPNNCGGRGITCVSGAECVNGQCPSFLSDPNNCGRPGNVCPELQSCMLGGCIFADPENCGGLGIRCLPGQICRNRCI